MTDRDRVMLNIAVDTSGSVHNKMTSLDGGWQLRCSFGDPAPQFIPPELAEKIGMPMKPGDIVRCCTNPNHHWGISELVEQTTYSDFLLREIGGDRLLRMGNESVDVLRFMHESRLYTGVKHKLYQWARVKAFSERYNSDGDYLRRCGGVEFDGDKLLIWLRPHMCAMEKKGENGEALYAQPKKFTVKWDKKTRLKDIIAAMREQGFTEDFEYAAGEPKEGMAGYVKITRDTLVGMLQKATR